LLQNDDISQVEEKIDSIIEGKNYEAAKIRFLRALFPDQIAAVDAPNKLWRLLNSVKNKLGVLTEGSNIERHQQLMNLVESEDISKKQIFFWELFYILENNLNLKKAIVYYGAPGTGKTYKAKKIAQTVIRLKQFNSTHHILMKILSKELDQVQINH